MKIFIGGSLTNANQDLFEMYERIERFCENRDALVYNPSAQYKRLKELNISDYDAYWNCASKFLSCTHAIMYIGQPSLGVGIELAKLKMMNIPTICYYFEGEKVSDYTLGFLSTGKNFKIIKDITSYTWLFSYMVGVDWLKENSHGGVFHNERQKHIKKGR